MKEKIKNNFKFPRLTREEIAFFKEKDINFFRKFGLHWPLCKRIASALQTLAVAKLVGGYQGIGEVNKKEAVGHHIKACLYDPSITFRCPAFRREAGLLVYNEHSD